MTVRTRPATSDDLDALIDFEIDIARESFGDEALTDRDQHRGRLSKALERDPDGCLVAVDEADAAIGWCWMTINRNFLTGDPYATFRSLAVAPGPEQSAVSRELVRIGLDYAWAHEVTQVTGKVNAANTAMRTLYREFGFEPQHLTMRLQRDEP